MEGNVTQPHAWLSTPQNGLPPSPYNMCKKKPIIGQAETEISTVDQNAVQLQVHNLMHHFHLQFYCTFLSFNYYF